MPQVSVILPVYNAEKYLRQAIDSILNQTFTDFEFILINDGSTDGSENIIKQYTDARIVYLENKTNKGLIYTLNRGIDESNGEFIARMDADDISLPERFEKQVRYLRENKIEALGTRVKLVDENENALPDWKDDEANISPIQIRKFLLKNNCIAHPTMMAKASLFKNYKYRYSQKYSEDYDLWLRWESDGVSIHKLDEQLLLYRILPTSETRLKKINVFSRIGKVKLRFAISQIKKGKFNGYVLSAFFYAGVDALKATGKTMKSLFK